MATRYTSSSYLLTLGVFFLFATVVNGFKERFEPVEEGYNRDKCLAKVLKLLNESKIYSNDSIFYRGDNGTIFSSPKRPIITLDGCYEMCGTKYGWYKDIGNRLSTWLIPVFLLLSNMEVSPLDKRRYLGILHLLGDPIDSLLSMLIKLEAWSRCHYLAVEMTDMPDDAMRRNIATVLGGFEELIGFYEDPAEVYTRVKNCSLKRYNSEAYFDHLVSRTAHQLADSRTDERIRTVFATVLYIYQLISAFVSVVGGGNTTLPGGRIGLAMFMTWIVGSILISNAMGTYTSRRVCYDKIEAFVKAATGQERGWQTMKEVAPTLKDHGSVSNFMRNLSWNGAIYSYRPKKTLPFKGRKHGHSLFLLTVIAAAPIAISSIIASFILWNTPPIGLNCRNIIIFVLTAVVFISAGLTHLSSHFLKGAWHWYIVLAKDLMVAIPSILLIFLACAGRFNSCWCWSGAFSLGSKARVILETIADFEKYNATTYPIMVGICLTFQCLAFVGMMWVGWRGWNVMRWSETEKAEGWKQSRVPPRAVTRDVSPTKKQVLVETREIISPRIDA